MEGTVRGKLGGIVCAAVAVAAAVSPASAWADDCPNARFRAGASAALPECRAYEQVSPVDKNGNAITTLMGARPEGDGAAFKSIGAFSGSNGSLSAFYTAVRGAEGWKTIAQNPPMTGRVPVTADEYRFDALSNDYTRSVIRTEYPVDPDDQGLRPQFGRGWDDLYRREADGSFTWLTHGATLPDNSTAPTALSWASGDLERVVFSTQRALTPEIPSDNTATQLYVRAGDALHALGIGPDGAPLPGGSTLYGAADDLSRVVLGATGGMIYLRTDALDPARATTRPVLPATASDLCPNPQVLAVSRDVRRVVFVCRGQLTADATPEGGLYSYDVNAGELRFLTPQVPKADGSYEVLSSADRLAADPDLRHLYIRTNLRLTPGLPTATNMLYDIDVDAGNARLVAVVGGASMNPADFSLTPDGTRMVFETDVALAPGYDTGGRQQVYLYDGTAAEAERLACVSCRPDGTPSGDDSALVTPRFDAEFQAIQRRDGNVSADGRRVFFTSADRLLPQATNGELNAYEWLDGRLHLLSSGKDPYPAVFAGASTDGRDAFILTHESLVEQDIDGSVTDLYVARIGGGFPAPAADPLPCEGSDECQGAAASAPARTVAATVTFAGAGDVRAPARAAKPKVSARRSVLGRRFTIAVRTPGAGRIAVGGRYLTPARRTARRAATYHVRIRLSARGRKRLQRRRALKVRPRVTFRPSGGRATSSPLTVKLRLPATRKGR